MTQEDEKKKQQKDAEDYVKAYESGLAEGQKQASDALKGLPETPDIMLEKPVDNKPVSDYVYNQNLINSILRSPMTSEEEERRIRRAQAIDGIGAFGNALSAFSNLAFTGAGAPSQTLPSYPKTEEKIKEMRDRNQKDRENYLRYKTLARNADRAEYAQDQNMRNQQIGNYNQGLMQRYNAENSRFQYGANLKNQLGQQFAGSRTAALNYAQQEQARRDNNAKQNASLAIQRANLAETRRMNDFAIEKYKDEAAIKALGNTKLEKSTVKTYIPRGDGSAYLGYVSVDWSASPEGTVQLYNALPDTIKNKYRRAMNDAKGDAKKRAKLMRDAVVDGLSNDIAYSAKAYEDLDGYGMLSSGSEKSDHKEDPFGSSGKSDHKSNPFE